MAIHVKDSVEFEAKLTEAGTHLVVVDFHATWCGPCKLIAPRIEELAAEHPDVIFLKVDVDECEDIAAQYSITAMPTFLFIKEKKTLTSFSGANGDKLQLNVLQYKISPPRPTLEAETQTEKTAEEKAKIGAKVVETPVVGEEVKVAAKVVEKPAEEDKVKEKDEGGNKEQEKPTAGKQDIAPKGPLKVSAKFEDLPA